MRPWSVLEFQGRCFCFVPYRARAGWGAYALHTEPAAVPPRCITLAAILSRAIVSVRGQRSKRRDSFIGVLGYRVSKFYYYNARNTYILYNVVSFFCLICVEGYVALLCDVAHIDYCIAHATECGVDADI